MERRLFLILILSHLIGDFVIQNQALCELRFPKKEVCGRKSAFKSIMRGNLKHCLLHLIVLVVLILMFLPYGYPENSHWMDLGVWSIIGICLIYLGSHLLIDSIKSWITYQHKEMESNLLFFLGDQLLHLVVIGLMFLRTIPLWIQNAEAYITVKEWADVMLWQDKLLIEGIVVIFSTFFAGIFIKIFMDYLDVCNAKAYQKTQKSSKKRKGKEVQSVDGETENGNDSSVEIDGEIRQGGYIIGILERIFILCAMAINTPQLIGFMLTVKSIVRLKKMSKDKFAEYFLIGNLLSFLFAILPGVLLQNML